MCSRTPGPYHRVLLSSTRSILWPVFLVNAAVLLASGALLLLTPVTVSSRVALAEAAVVVVALCVLLVADLVLLRRVLRPLRELATAMEDVDPADSTAELRPITSGSTEVGALAAAFDRMVARLEAERRTSARRALRAQEDERRRIARELHDDVGQSLTAAAIAAESAGAEVVAAQLRATLDDVRRIARELRPAALDDLGLAPALLALGRRVGAQGGVRVRTTIGDAVPALGGEAELVVYRVAQEALTNALRHADARAVDVRLEDADGRVRLTVVDDGVGIPDDLPADTAGLAGMRERTMLVDGRLEVARRPGGGTRVTFDVAGRRGADDGTGRGVPDAGPRPGLEVGP